MAVAHKYPLLFDGRHLISPPLMWEGGGRSKRGDETDTHQRGDDGRGSQAPTLIRRPTLDIPTADAKVLTGGRMMVLASKHPLLFDAAT